MAVAEASRQTTLMGQIIRRTIERSTAAGSRHDARGGVRTLIFFRDILGEIQMGRKNRVIGTCLRFVLGRYQLQVGRAASSH